MGTRTLQKHWLDLAKQLDCLTSEEQNLLELRRSELTPISQGEAELNANQIALACDVAVRNTAHLARLPADLQEDVQRVRNALAKIESREDAAGLELLQPIGFRSPLAPWRLFARGLVVFYQADYESAKSIWSKIPVGRFPERIVSYLLKSIGQSVSASVDDSWVARTRDKLFCVNEGKAIVTRISRCLADNDFQDLEKALNSLARSEAIVKSWKVQLTNLLWSRFSEIPDELVDDFCLHNNGPTWDPKWEFARLCNLRIKEPGKFVEAVHASLAKISGSGGFAPNSVRALGAAAFSRFAYSVESQVVPSVPIKNYADFACRFLLEAAKLEPSWPGLAVQIKDMLEYAPHPDFEQALHLCCEASSKPDWTHYFVGQVADRAAGMGFGRRFFKRGFERFPRAPVYHELLWSYVEKRLFVELLAKRWQQAEQLIEWASQYALPTDRWQIGWMRCILAVKRKDANCDELIEQWIAEGTERLTAYWLLEWASVPGKFPAAKKKPNSKRLVPRL